MKRLILLISSFFLLSLSLVGGASLVHAQRFQTGDNVSIGSPNPIRQTVFVSGKTVDISSEVFGDVFCAGQTVTISGTVHGDIMCAGQTVNINGDVDGSVRLAGQSVNLSSAVGRNATIAAQSFVLDSKGSIGGDVSLGATDGTLHGPVGRDVAAGGTTLLVANTVGRNIQASVTNLKLASGARVNGNVVVTSNNPVDKASGAVVTGKITRSAPSQAQQKHNFWGFAFLWVAYWFVAMLVMALVLALLFPRMLQTVTDRALPRPWKPLLTGFIATIVAPVVLILLAITVIGLPIAFVLGLLWLVALIVSGPLSAFYLGRMILRRSHNALLIMLVGALVLALLYLIPFLDILVGLVAFWLGIGMLLLDLFRRTPKPSYEIAPLSADTPKK